MNLRRRRLGVELVVAEVVLIAITLIAGIIIASYAFGLLGSSTKVATLAARAVGCDSADDGACTVAITNDGTAAGAVYGCEVYSDTGQLTTGVLTHGASNSTINAADPLQIPAGQLSPIPVTCHGSNAPYVAGASAAGIVEAVNGAALPFSGVWK